MQRSTAVVKTVPAYVKWEEIVSTNRKGRKEVRYYLKRRDGTSDLAVIGKEKKLGQHTKPSSSSSYRYRYANRDKPLFSSLNLPFEVPSKLRSRRDVVDCLSSVVSDGSFAPPTQPVNSLLGSDRIKGIDLHKSGGHTTQFLWVGSSWTCRKKRKHYGAYTRSGVRISVQDFVYVLAEANKRLVAYINDLYEDSRGNKTAVVQWFHKTDEVGLDLPCTPPSHNNEIFFSLCLQDLSIECIDGLAAVLSPQHYDTLLKSAAPTVLDPPFVCQYQFENEKVKVKVKPFDVTQVKGYWNQNILTFLSNDDISNRPTKKVRLVENEHYLGSEIEVLSQDSGIRGVWFRAVVVKKHKDKIKVRYQDLKDPVDESVNLEEWILSSAVAGADELGIRHGGRMTVRPARLADKIDARLIDAGCIVDAWLYDGWWEGIVVHKESDDRIHVYLPGENEKTILGSKDLRYSQEWLGDSWNKMKDRPDILGLISRTSKTVSETLKSTDNVSSGLSSEEHRDFEAGLLANLNWNWSTKKKRGMNVMKTDSLVTGRTRKPDGFSMPVAVKVNCKFTSRVTSSVTSLVMSR